MKKKHIISLTGDLASGKGETSRILIEKLGYGIYRNGQYFRKLAKEMNMTVTEFNIYVEDHPDIDRQIENSAAEYAKTNALLAATSISTFKYTLKDSGTAYQPSLASMIK